MYTNDYEFLGRTIADVRRRRWSSWYMSEYGILKWEPRVLIKATWA